MADEKIIIEKNGTIITLGRKDVMEIKHSHDGIVFNLINGLHIYAADSFMPRETKDKIISTFDMFKNTDIKINLGSYNVPVKAEVKS